MRLFPQVHGYILAGGQSSRMGTDKALLSFAHLTLLDRVAATLAHLCSDVTVLGPHRPAFPHLRFIPDRTLAAGPVAGVVSALEDVAARQGQWALFTPVDVPLLPPGLLDALAALWLTEPHTRLAFPFVGGCPQPVICLVHVTALESITRSLNANQLRLRAAMELAAADLARQFACPRDQVLRTPAITVRDTTVFADEQSLPWRPSVEELTYSDLWFANANTPAELNALRLAISANHLY